MSALIQVGLRLFGAAMALCAGASVSAQVDIPGYPASVEQADVREVAMLPSYCKYTQVFRGRVAGGSDQTQVDYWYATLGPTFHAMHHYCWGLMKTNRSVLLASERQAKIFYLESAITEFDYVITHASEDFVLLPEILTKKGENYIRLGRPWLAIPEFERAMELKPDYWPPYAHLSDHFKSTGDRERARELLTRGLSFAPDAKALRSRLAELETQRPRSAKP